MVRSAVRALGVLIFCALSLIGLIFVGGACATPSEYIARFDVQVAVEKDGALTIVETIDYAFDASLSRRGMFRDFPTAYAGPMGTNYTVELSQISAFRDGKKEHFRLEPIENGMRIRLGRADVFLAPGVHRYEIHYRTNRQILFSSQTYDELSWNVTGNLWRIPIFKAQIAVIFPPEIPVAKVSIFGYTGRFGERGSDYTVKADGKHVIYAETTVPLAPRAGFSLSLSWPKGLIIPPSAAQEFWWFVRDNPGLILFFLVFIALIIFYIVTWRWVRKTQDVGPVIPLFHPPEGLSPAGCRYVLQMGYDARQLAAEMVNLAVHGAVKIDYDPKWFGKGTYRLSKVVYSGEDLSALQQGLLGHLFQLSDLVELGQEGRPQVQNAAQFMRSQLGKAFGANFVYNAWYSVWTGVISCVTVLVAWGLDGWFNPVVPLLLFGVVGVGAFMLRAYTNSGCKLRDQIKGFVMYLKAAETERLDIIGTPPTRTPELFEKYLPYAIALDAERQWTRQFASVFKALEMEQHPYSPIWFGGRLLTLSAMDAFSSDLGSFASDFNIPLSSYKTPSGAGGGGFSGGGRGGGGGGGW
ncbi:TPA: hypothetical protein DDZ86_03420 [Candidatus Dependentiae bacterium]|nr:MAG: hypothetical protein UW09_C0003G0036 [candidate division TM6 bacterium GW2011_GWF2_43_87]HBL98665.1 hypothetical protein [Candidatus Dependentiae bacterium]